MKEFLLILRANAFHNTPGEDNISTMEQWNEWIMDMVKQGKFQSGNPLTPEGKYLPNADTVIDAPFAEGKEIANGYTLITAADYDEAVALSKKCPIFYDKGSIEIREIVRIEIPAV